jgi:hypothetical protein
LSESVLTGVVRPRMSRVQTGFRYVFYLVS